MDDALKAQLGAAAGILGPAAAILGGLAAVGGLALIFDNGLGSLNGASSFPGYGNMTTD